MPLDINDPNSPITQFDADGNLLPFVPGGGTGSVIFQNGGDGLSLSDFTQLYNDVERYNTTAFLKYELTESVSVNAEAWFSRTEATEVVNQPFFNSSAFGGLPADGYGNVNSGPIPVLIDNPFPYGCHTQQHQDSARRAARRGRRRRRRPDHRHEWRRRAGCRRLLARRSADRCGR